MTKLFDILLQTARALEALQEGVASAASGGATTLVDSQLVVRGFTDDDFFNGGTLLYQSATEANRASRLVTDYAGTTGLITLGTALAETPALGARYGVLTRRYPREMLSAKVNEVLVELGDVPQVDISLITASNQWEYDLTAAARRDLRQVWLARKLAVPYDWEPQLRVRPSTSASAGTAVIIFPEQPRVGYRIKLVYAARPAAVALDTDLVSDYVSVDVLGLAAAEKLARWRLEGPGADERDLTALLNNLTLRLAQARRRHPAPLGSAPRFPVLA
jgi:hypothetical protein